MGKRTPFYELHLKAHAKMVEFAGFEMPIHYGSQLDEHLQVRTRAGLFDVSHMGIVDLHGKEATPFLRYLLANNIDKLKDGGALYTCMLNEAGGVLDDLIVYRFSADAYRIVLNAAVREKDLAWMQSVAQSFAVTLEERTDLAMLALQGPLMREKIARFLPASSSEIILNLKPFTFATRNHLFIACTGYTGELGYEIIFPAKDAAMVWNTCLLLDILPCGLGARDTLRLEAGLNLYGNDMTEAVTPLVSNLAWTVSFDDGRPFIGREALLAEKAAGIKTHLVGILLEGPGVMRAHHAVFKNGRQIGELTSGGYSPTLSKSIGFARVASGAKIGEHCEVVIRDKHVPARLVKLPFVRQGKVVCEIGSKELL